MSRVNTPVPANIDASTSKREQNHRLEIEKQQCSFPVSYFALFSCALAISDQASSKFSDSPSVSLARFDPNSVPSCVTICLLRF